LSKSFHALPPTLIAFVLIIWCNGYKTLRLKHLLIFIFCGLAPVLIWGCARYLYDGTQFFSQMFGYDLIERSRNTIEGHNSSVFYYISILKRNFSRIFIFLVALFLFVIANIWKNRKNNINIYFIKQNNIIILQICFCIIIPTIMFSCAASKLTWYIYPTFPFLSLLFAHYIYVSICMLLKLFSNNKHQISIIMLVIVFLCYLEVRTIKKIIKESHMVSPVQNILYDANRLNKYGDNTPVYLENMPWRQNLVLAAKLYGNFQPRDGGRLYWSEDGHPGAILITDKLSIEIQQEQ
jgi:hypothetical protein